MHNGLIRTHRSGGTILRGGMISERHRGADDRRLIAMRALPVGESSSLAGGVQKGLQRNTTRRDAAQVRVIATGGGQGQGRGLRPGPGDDVSLLGSFPPTQHRHQGHSRLQ